MHRFRLNDAQWQAIAACLPTRQSGPKRANDRVVISGIIHVLLSGCPWRECPHEYGPSMTVFNRYNRWRQSGIWDRIVVALGPSLSPNERDKLAATEHRAQPARSSFGTDRRSASAADRFSDRAWDDAAAQLRRIALAHHGRPITAWIDAVVEWHMDALFVSEERHAARDSRAASDVKALIAGLGEDVGELQTRMLGLVDAMRTYLDRPAHNAKAARQQLRQIQDELSQRTSTPRHARMS